MGLYKCARGCSLNQSQRKGQARGSQGDFGSPAQCNADAEGRSNIAELTTEVPFVRISRSTKAEKSDCVSGIHVSITN